MMVTHNPIIPNDAILQYYFYFMQERMNIFWRKNQKVGCSMYWTDDPILQKFKFTNVYRVTDRVTQYLIREIILPDSDNLSPKDLLLRVIVFKIFNKIETWEYLKRVLNEPITTASFNPREISMLLTKYQRETPIFNNAYMMTGSHQKYDYLPTKHEKWLTMVKNEMIDGGALERMLCSNSLEDLYNVLHECSFIGPFLAYQYAIDLNYTPYFNYSENSFVKAGIGAIRGIKKCFISYGDHFEDAIHYIAKNYKKLQQKYGYTAFHSIPGHEPTLIDFQNCFCETDKYLRAKMPEIKVDNVRIKQIYKCHHTPIKYTFPKKWNIQTNIEYTPQNN